MQVQRCKQAVYKIFLKEEKRKNKKTGLFIPFFRGNEQWYRHAKNRENQRNRTISFRYIVVLFIQVILRAR